MIKENNIELIAIGNGTTSRETEQFVRCYQKYNLDIKFIIVNEAGPQCILLLKLLDLSFLIFKLKNEVVSIGRRVQDPLSELVKIDPKSIGVGQYQHDVNQKELESALTFVVENRKPSWCRCKYDQNLYYSMFLVYLAQ